MLNKSKQILLIAAAILFGLTLGWRTTLADDGKSTGILQVEIISDAELARFAALDVPVFAQFWDGNGRTTLLASGDSDLKTRLTQAGFIVRVLDQGVDREVYYLAGIPRSETQARSLAGVNLIQSIDGYLLLRAAPGDVEKLPEAGIHIERLTSHPLVLPAQADARDQTAAITPDPAIQAMIDQVSVTSAYNYVGGLSGEWSVQVNGGPYTFATRYSKAETPIKKATKFVQEHFLGLGLTTYYSTFYIESGTIELRNVIADQPGVTDPDCIVLLVGHLDSISPSASSLAPGADDNASGTAGVLIGADILSQYDFACSIRYVAFTGEEQGMLGSKDYASIISGAGENIVAVVNLDMIAYNSDAYEIIGLHTRPGNAGDLAIANLFVGVVQAYSINLTPEVVQDNERFSDHSSFWDYGYSAILCIEDYDNFTPYYHTTSDTLSTLDTAYMADFIRAAVGTVAHLAGPIPPNYIYFPFFGR
jgi:hypothetical protein